MKMRLIPPVAAQGAWLIAGRSAAGAVLLAVTVSACTGSSSSVPSIFTPTPQTSGQSPSQAGTRTPSPTGQASRSSGGAAASASASAHASSSAHAAASSSARAAASHSAAPTRTVTHTAAPTTLFPTAAPETGGGGTAGLQDGVLFGVGGAAVLVGLGTLAYRRRLARKFGIGAPAEPDPADREPVDR